ncbi:coenzyme F420 biosynthesis-associated protein [Modestobacter sp. I12A-02628]|uniref:Zinc-dependent metalloprotease n=1 Tax=Goekera deserti TaxID=2497753 RepID=A0A7K3WJ11_9ACTN|nr:zinc-dependent metalloprotease [Goekera deserti]MPQ98158.1 coenzyme F420 biosynthesis-associated protein [Goekera deserti]NDI48807.1 coenzyme F420 biosynthesis-associated protein [Goekera deserti]NEL56488.1 zinc-dependent metalloprotease [Goekera deserti]
MSSPSSLVDWDLAGRTARRLLRPGPATTREEAAAVVRELHEAAALAVSHVEGLTGLHPVPGGPEPTVAVVDRPGWVDANAAGMSALITPLAAALQEKQGRQSGRLATAVGSRVTGAQAGGLLAFISSRVLGQYEVFGTDGRLLLVAPNIVETERRLGVDPSDFRLWVCLHEVTHQLQFTAVPWLKPYLEAQMGEFIEATDLTPDLLRERLGDVVRSLSDAVRGTPTADDDAPQGLMALVSDPAQRAVLDRVTAVMSLVEGHAEFVMDGVGPDVVPSVVTLRKRFNQRRKGRGPIDRVLRRLLGLEQKMQQYADGRHFVSGVVAQVGMTGFNTVWTGPETLPLKEELTAPEQWVQRVLGVSPAVHA